MSDTENNEKKEPVIRGYDKHGKPYYWPTEQWRQPKPKGAGLPRPKKDTPSDSNSEEGKGK